MLKWRLGILALTTMVSSALFGVADDQWAYCDVAGPGLATARLSWPCENSPDKYKLCGPAKPQANWVCRTPSAGSKEAGPDRIANRNRCVNANRHECATNAGGQAGPGDHNVPVCAVYVISAGESHPEALCRCVPPQQAYGPYCNENSQLTN